MKKLKKLLSIVLAVAMVMSLAVSVGAVADYSITITNSTSGYEYYAYQIFKGDFSSGTLSNIDWGTGVNLDATTSYTSIYAALATIQAADGSYPFTSDHTAITATGTVLTSATEVAEALASTTYVNDSTVVEQFAEIIALYLSDTNKEVAWDSGNNYYYAEFTDPGYYLITNTVAPISGAYSAYIVQVLGTEEMSPKSSIPSLDKTVTDVNDSTGETSTGETADYDYGDTITFTLTATIGDNFDKYDEYMLVFHDVLSSGLTYVSISSVTIDDKTVASGNYTVSTSSTDVYVVSTTPTQTADITSGGYYTLNEGVYAETDADSVYDSNTTYYVKDTSGASSLTISFADLKASYFTNNFSITKDSKIVVTYTATLDTDADYTENNYTYVEYSNNPNAETTGVTTVDLTTVFNYSLTVNKVIANTTTALDGAGFTLYKLVAYDSSTSFDDNGTYYTLSGTTYTKATDATSSYTPSTLGNGPYYYFKEIETISTGTTFYFDGLDEGVYMLHESTTPPGYNTTDDLYFSITAATSEDANGSGKLDSLTVYEVTGGGTSSMNVTTNVISSNTTGETFLSTIENNTDGKLSTTVENSSGSVLPETGGIGVTIFYVVGGILVLAAAGVIVISKKKIKK